MPRRWVLIRDPLGRFEAQALLCTDLAVAPEADRGLVRAAWAGGSHLRRSAPPPGGRDAAPMVRPGDPAHHAGVVGVVLAGHVVGTSSVARSRLADAAVGLVGEGRAQLLGCPGLLAFTTLARPSYLAVAYAVRHGGNTPRAVGLPGRDARFCNLTRPAMDKVERRGCLAWQYAQESCVRLLDGSRAHAWAAQAGLTMLGPTLNQARANQFSSHISTKFIRALYDARELGLDIPLHMR